MNRRIEGWLEQRWYGGIRPGPGLRLLASVYGVVLRLRTRRAAPTLPVPVLVIGNFTVGGTGKTPLVIAIANELSKRGYRPGIVSRGYGRKTTGAVRVGLDTTVEQCGDEPLLMFERTGLPVFVDGDRVAAARRAIADGCNLVIADDGLQHQRLPRDVEIEVVDGERGYGNGLLLPAGPLRELPRRCDLRVVNGGRPLAAGDWTMRLVPGAAVSLSNSTQRRLLADFTTQRVHAVAGIGHPQRFFATLAQAGLSVIPHPFPDHHDYRRDDFPSDSDAVLMTEKDAVKCHGLGLANAWKVPVEAQLPAEFMPSLLSLFAKP